MANAHAVTLPEMLDISAFDALRELLLAAAKQKGVVVLDAAKVEKLTTPCVQLLAAFLKEDSKKPKRKIIAPSPALAAAWADFGLHHSYPLEQL